MAWLDHIWERLENFVPVERWIQAVNNVLRYLSLAFVLLFVLILLLIVGDWGFTPVQRILLICVLLLLLFIALLIAMFLAIRGGDLLYSPYERSLRRGRNYGTADSPITKQELEKSPPPMENPLLQLPPEANK